MGSVLARDKSEPNDVAESGVLVYEIPRDGL